MRVRRCLNNLRNVYITDTPSLTPALHTSSPHHDHCLLTLQPPQPSPLHHVPRLYLLLPWISALPLESRLPPAPINSMDTAVLAAPPAATRRGVIQDAARRPAASLSRSKRAASCASPPPRPPLTLPASPHLAPPTRPAPYSSSAHPPARSLPHACSGCQGWDGLDWLVGHEGQQGPGA